MKPRYAPVVASREQFVYGKMCIHSWVVVVFSCSCGDCKHQLAADSRRFRHDAAGPVAISNPRLVHAIRQRHHHERAFEQAGQRWRVRWRLGSAREQCGCRARRRSGHVQRICRSHVVTFVRIGRSHGTLATSRWCCLIGCSLPCTLSPCALSSCVPCCLWAHRCNSQRCMDRFQSHQAPS